MILNGAQITLTPFELTTDTAFSGVVTVVTYPAGIEYLSHTGDGLFNGTNWLSSVSPTDSPTKTLTITVVVTDAAAFMMLPPEDRQVVAVTTAVPGEVNLADNTQTRDIGQPCPDMTACVVLPTYSTMCAALEALGVGQFFKYAVDNADEATAGSVHVTEEVHCGPCCESLLYVPPTITCQALSVQCFAEFVEIINNQTGVQAEGGCGPTVEPFFQQSTGPCPTIVETHWRVTDECENTDECVQTITVFNVDSPDCDIC